MTIGMDLLRCSQVYISTHPDEQRFLHYTNGVSTGFGLHSREPGKFVSGIHVVSRRNNTTVSDDMVEMDRRSMEEWLLTKPAGFGADKVYDTTLEDKLLDEIDRDKSAQAAALLRKKKDIKSNNEQKKPKKEKVPPPSGVKVCIGDLPKKKNIDRDLQLAFGNVQGLLHINPSVLGNEKTRDPVCKGFGFLTFRSLDSAQSFVSSYQDKEICFGKVYKKPSYKIEESSIANEVRTSVHPMTVSKLRVRDRSALLDTSLLSFSKPELAFDAAIDDAYKDGEVEEESEPTQTDFKEESSAAVTSQFKHAEFGHEQHTFSSDEEEEEDEEEEGEEELDKKGGVRQEGDMSDMEDECMFSVDVSVEGISSFSEREGLNSSIEASPGQLSEDEERIKQLEKRVLQKFIAAGFGPREQTMLKELGEKPEGFSMKTSMKPAKPAKPASGRSAGPAKRQRKRESQFLQGAIQKYGKRPS